MNFASSSKWIVAVSAAAFLSLAGLAHAGDGRPRAGQSFHRTTTHVGPQGRTATSNYSRTITENGFNRSKSVTGPNGKTASRTNVGAYDASTNTWTSNLTRTGPNGATATKSRTVTRP